MLSTLALVVVGAFFVERFVELAINARNVRGLAARGAVFLKKDGFGLIVVAQGAMFVLTFVELLYAPWSGVVWWTWPVIVLLVLSQALRYWAIFTLGGRWSARVVTLPGAPRIAKGPYRYFPHPNYVAVMAEGLLLPLCFAAYGATVVSVLLHAVSLRRRIQAEERALDAAELGAPAGA